MPYKSVYIEPETVLEYKDVIIYRGYGDMDWNDPLTCWFVVDPEDEEKMFDVRKLPRPQELVEKRLNNDDKIEVLKFNIDRLLNEGKSPHEVTKTFFEEYSY